MSKNDSPCGDWLLKVILGWSLSAWMRLIFEYSAKRDAGDLRLPKFQHLMASLNSRSLSTESAEILNFGVERIGESGLGLVLSSPDRKTILLRPESFVQFAPKCTTLSLV